MHYIEPEPCKILASVIEEEVKSDDFFCNMFLIQ